MTEKKKIGIITILKVNNYGAELQAYATQKALQLMGYDAEIIDYLFYKNPRHIATPTSRPVFHMSVKKRLAEYLYPKISNFKHIFQRKGADKVRKEHFDLFHKENTKFSAEYRSYTALKNANLNYDAYIIGSDQVWNPGNYTSLEPYFLKFAPSDKPRFSYASSFGVGELPKNTWAYYSEVLKGLTDISVREENAVGLVKQLSCRAAKWVLDPTLLLDAEDWNAVSKEIPSLRDTKYVLLYELTPCPYLKILSKHIAEELGTKVVRITKDAVRVEADEDVVNVLDAGPAEFLWLFKNSDFVVTNSFHGAAFSINLNKNFYVVTPARKQNNSRQQSLLKLFGLTDRLLLEDAPLPNVDSYLIDFAPVNEKLKDQRVFSKDFIKHSIDGE